MLELTLTKGRMAKRVMAAVTALMITAAPTLADTVNLRAHTTAPGQSAFEFSTTMQTVLQKHLDMKLNMTSGIAVPRSALDAANGEVDLYISAPTVNYFMEKGAAMFGKTENVGELHAKLRGIVNFPIGPYHIITFADSGIEKLEDIKGRKVFLGPIGGAATAVAVDIVTASTGYKPNADYEQARLDWSSGQQAFQDRQVDVMIIPTALPSPVITQLSLLSEIRLLGIDTDKLDNDLFKKIMALPGRTVDQIPAKIYGDNQVNEGPVNVIGSWIGIGTHVGLDEQVAYDITKTMFENIGEFHASAEWMKTVTLDTALSEMNVPLHAGALRYYREVGIEVPEALVPEEAK